MFVDEIKSKYKLQDIVCPFSIVVFGDCCVACDGAKSVVLSNQNEIKIKVKDCVIVVSGNQLSLIEIGGENVQIKGEISGIIFEK